MKKFSLLMCATALLGLCFTSCNPQNGNKDLDDVVENGFYVIGEASAIADMSADNAKLGLMGAGINECTKEARAGLYEKYVALEGGKDFELVYVDGDQITHYGADSLALGDPYDVENGVTIQIYKGILAQNKKLRVEKSGFYHIALDLNVNGDLPNASILISPVDWQLSDGTALTASDFNKTSMSFTVKDVTKMKNSQYKYRWGNGWKIKVTPAAEVNIETNLGEGMKSGGADIKITKSGVYDFTLTWTLTGGAIEKSFKETLNCTKEIEDKAPDNLYMIGNFCSWGWESAAAMIPVGNGAANGQFWTIKSLKANEGFKFNANTEWDGGEYASLTTCKGMKVADDGNGVVEADGVYMIVVDYNADAITVEPAAVYGMNAWCGNTDWTAGFEAAKFTANEGKLTFTAVSDCAAGELRMYAASSVITADWWQHEFTVQGGKIVYRGIGGDLATTDAIKAGDKLVLDFNAGTATIGDVPVVPDTYVDGFFYVDCATSLIATPNIYSWSDAKGNLFGDWPGTALTTKDGNLYKIAYHAVKDAEYKAIINGTEGQTVDSNPLVLTGQDVLVTVGAKEGDKFTITFANK